MDKRDLIKTGDVLLFSGNTPTGFLLKTFVSSDWNHSGIAIRFTKNISTKRPNGEIENDTVNNYKISLTEEGELYILETNTGSRKDDIYGDIIVGAGFSHADYVFRKYNHVSVRSLHPIFRTQELADLTIKFSTLHRGNEFPSSTLPFLSVWLGISLQNSTEINTEMFCSELMAHYYSYCVGPQYQKLTNSVSNLSTLFGQGSPTSENMFTPGHYSSLKTPNASIFSGEDTLIYVAHADFLYVILQPFLIILVIMLAIWMSLPKN